MKRIVSIFLLLFMIFPTCSALSDTTEVELSTLSEVPGEYVEPMQATTRTVYLETSMVLAYESPVRKRSVQVVFASTAGPDPIYVGIKYLDTEQDHWVPLSSQTQCIDLRESAVFELPRDARYKIYVQNGGATYGNVVLQINGTASDGT